MAVLAVGAGDGIKQKASQNHFCHEHMEAFSNLVFA